jgi:hypothetical protein
MKDALSLLKTKIINAEDVDYENLSKAQLVCPECFEPVFKKEMYVRAWEENTHFFSHYTGPNRECSRRSPNEDANKYSGEGAKRAQALEEFNSEFMRLVKNGAKKYLTSTQYFKSLDFFDAAKKLDKNSLLEHSKEMLIESLAEPINESIDPSLHKLECALLPIYNHFISSYGENNLRYLTYVSLICIFKGKEDSLENIIKKSSSVKYLKQKLLGVSILILSNYLGWDKSIKKVEIYLNNLSNNDLIPVNSIYGLSRTSKELNTIHNYLARETPQHSVHYNICPLCGTQTFVRDPGDNYCRVCDANRQNNFSKYLTPDSQEKEILKEGYINRSTLSTRWFYSIPKNEFNEYSRPLIRKASQDESLAVISTNKRWIWNKNNRTLFDAANFLEYSFDAGQIVAEWESNPMRFLIRPDLSRGKNPYVNVDEIVPI